MQAAIWALWHNEHQARFKNADKQLEIDCSLAHITYLLRLLLRFLSLIKFLIWLWWKFVSWLQLFHKRFIQLATLSSLLHPCGQVSTALQPHSYALVHAASCRSLPKWWAWGCRLTPHLSAVAALILGSASLYGHQTNPINEMYSIRST